MQQLHDIQVKPIIQRALEEDWSYGDWTTDLVVSQDRTALGRVYAEEPLMVAGLDVLAQVFQVVDPQLNIQHLAKQGDWAQDGDVLLQVEGSARSILKAERVGISLASRMCGIATLTRKFVEQLEGTKTKLRDTRKTTPGHRLLEKSAALVGGARNHRFGLCDGVVVKENHIRCAGDVKTAVSHLLESLSPTMKIEVEASSEEGALAALNAGADLIILNNMSVSEITETVGNIGGRALVEVSGLDGLEQLQEIGAAGVDFVSTGVIVRMARWSQLRLVMAE